jgi:hypothetical protein
LESFFSFLKNLINSSPLPFFRFIIQFFFEKKKNWTSPYFPSSAGFLNEYGQEEHYNASLSKIFSHFQKKFFLKKKKGWKNRLYPLLSQKFTTDQYPIYTTKVQRASKSGNSFGYGLFEGKGNLGQYNYEPFYSFSDSPNEDVILRFFENCPNYDLQIKETNASSNSITYLGLFKTKIAREIQLLLNVTNGKNKKIKKK